MHCENVSEKEPIFAGEGATVRALLKNKNSKKYGSVIENVSRMFRRAVRERLWKDRVT
jgi:hypothetical protein